MNFGEPLGDPPQLKVHPKENANFFSTICFSWTVPIFYKGFHKELTEKDLYGPLKEHESGLLGDKLENAWNLEVTTKKQPSFTKALCKVFGGQIMLRALVVIIEDLIIKISQPLFLGKLLGYYVPNQTTVSKNEATVYACLIVLAVFIQILIGHWYVMGNQHIGMKIRVACCSLIYRKSLKLSKTSLAQTTVGKLVNLLSNDVNRFDALLNHFHVIWSAPVTVIIVTYLLYSTVGIYSLVGIVLIVLFIPLQMYLGKKSSKYRFQIAGRTDERIRLMNEIICGIQVIKMYTWEKPFAMLVKLARKLEIQPITSTSYIRAANVSFTIFMNRTAVFLCILTYVLVGNEPTAYYVFVITSFYNILRQCMIKHLPKSITSFAEASTSIERIQTFLLYQETCPHDQSDHLISKKHLKGVQLQNATAKWLESSTDNTLTDLNLEIPPTQLAAIIGPVGSGKSSLLQVILKELPLIFGNIQVGGVLSYAPQEPWLFVGSIRQNILFGQPLDVAKYKEVIRVCALERDFDLFPFGDKTIVGERGVMLSGGQKARINLARAVYKDADIYLLDDPLSAVDTHVGRQLFDDCISKYLKNKCVILVTHQLQYLRMVDKIFLMENGRLELSGTFEEVQESGKDFTKLLDQNQSKEEEVVVKNRKSKHNDDLEVMEGPKEVKEEQNLGSISGRIYNSYVKAGGKFTSVVVIIYFIITQLSASASDYFITFWVNLEQNKQEVNSSKITQSQSTMNGFFRSDFFSTTNCIYIYTVIIGLVAVITLIRSVSFMNFCMTASKNLHNTMFFNIVNASMRFFNTNPSGRILNRFSKDMGAIDENLPVVILDTIQSALNVLFIIMLIATVNPWSLIPTIIIIVIFYYLKVIFLASSRNIKRIEGISRSPVFSHMTASLQGITTIRAFGAQKILTHEFDVHQNKHSSAFYMFMACNRAFGFWLDMHSVFYIGFVTISFLIQDNETYGGNVGLVITQALSLTGLFQWGMRQWSELENQMTSVERVVEYTELPPEFNSGTKQPPRNWPEHGEIKFVSVSMRYSILDPYVLKSLSFYIKPMEKVGIVGRTGAGKSSLITALFRLAEFDGKIIIDTIDSKSISLENLRSKISIIPQEPVLFSGTLRKNLDPFDRYQDDELWKALQEVELKGVVTELVAGLNTKMSEGGSNFSVGQRQLVCLARAIIQKNKILVLDEATANVDPQTDALIQTTIRNKFKDCTVLTIAHRLHTVMDSDRILVLDAGSVVEFDHPSNLLENPQGVLYGLVQQTGKGMADYLIKIAHEAK